MKAIKVPLKKAQKTKEHLIKNDLTYKEYIPVREKEFIFYPVKGEVKGFKRIEKRFKKKKSLNGSLKLTKKEISLFPKSYDVVGDIAILDIPKELIKKERQIAEAFLNYFKNLKVITKKVGIHSGVYRTQNLEILAGENRKTTEHQESGLKMQLNAETCYFSPRLSTDREDVAKKIKKSEDVLVMFSGVAPYIMVISKKTKAKVTGIEINPEAHKFAKKNIKINKLKNIKLYQGDVKKVLPKLKKKFDRILMPLPRSSEMFLGLAKKYIKPKGTIHFYTFCEGSKLDKEKRELIKDYFPESKTKVRKCGQFAPGKYRLRVDIKT